MNSFSGFRLVVGIVEHLHIALIFFDGGGGDGIGDDNLILLIFGDFALRKLQLQQRIAQNGQIAAPAVRSHFRADAASFRCPVHDLRFAAGLRLVQHDSVIPGIGIRGQIFLQVARSVFNPVIAGQNLFVIPGGMIIVSDVFAEIIDILIAIDKIGGSVGRFFRLILSGQMNRFIAGTDDDMPGVPGSAAGSLINVNNKTTKNVAENFTNFDYLVCSSLLCGKMSFVR